MQVILENVATAYKIISRAGKFTRLEPALVLNVYVVPSNFPNIDI
jgi:hypothetical protein